MPDIQEAQIVSELTSRGVRDYSGLSFGEGLSRIARHELTLLCINCIHKELNPSDGKKRRRGRPTSPMGTLAIKLGVHTDSVKRWMDISQAQACDFNTTRLAEIAYRYDPEGVVRIIREDLARRKRTIDAWFKEIEANYPAPPYVENSHPRPYGDERTRVLIGIEDKEEVE